MIVVSAIWLGLLFLPLPSTGRVGATVLDLAHLPSFALFAVGIHRLAARRLGRGNSRILVWLALIAFSVLAEPIQSCFGRESCWSDAVANLVGVTAGTLWTTVSARRRLVWTSILLVGICGSLPPLWRLIQSV